MTNLKDQIEERIRMERDKVQKPERTAAADAGGAREQWDVIRPRLDELSHATDRYSLKVSYQKGPYSELIAVVELNDSDGTWVAAWQIAPTVGGSVNDWEVTYNPHGVETRHEWFAGPEDVVNYLTASIAGRVIEMETDEA